jgi:hypothetical protein
MIPEEEKKIFVSKYSTIGDEKFYRFLLDYAFNKIEENKDEIDFHPELELLDYHDIFIFLYRKENEPVYLEIAKLFRKAAHKIYYSMLKKNLCSTNQKFLNLVD